MDDDDTDVYIKGLLGKYAARRDSLETLCLPEFVSDYKFCFRQNTNTSDCLDEETIGIRYDNEILSAEMSLKNGLGKFSK